MALNDDNYKILGDCVTLERLLPPVSEGSELVVAIIPADYLASTIARAVEDTDAHLLNLNVMDNRTIHDELIVHLRVDRRDAGAVARSLERYGYRVLEAKGKSIGDDTDDFTTDAAARDRINHLLRMLEV